MGHSSVERVLLPQATGAVAYALETILQVFSELEVDSLRAANNLADYSSETQTHSIQTHFQSNGLSYVDAREATSDLYLSNPTQQTFRMAVNKHPLLIGYRTPTPPKEHFNEFL
jgi:adenylosuccinate lyase